MKIISGPHQFENRHPNSANTDARFTVFRFYRYDVILLAQWTQLVFFDLRQLPNLVPPTPLAERYGASNKSGIDKGE